ncbi:peroxisomal and mitochondrial division factor 1-like [Nicotiana sylvestris]|uniref:peroxisomal and mitochondrial division factor 1-like n=1 Tax=Nicotiana sylvestris TaxID=4096 RepID=UPI00388CB279
MRPPSRKEDVSPPVSKLVKDKKRKRILTSDAPKPKKSEAHKSKKDTVVLPAEVGQRPREEEEENEEDSSELVARTKRNTEAPKATELVRVGEIQPQIEMGLGRASVLHHESLFKSRRELSRYEAKIQGLTKEKNALRLLAEQREKEIKGLRVEPAMAQREQRELTEQVNKVLDAYGLGLGVMSNDSILQVQRLQETIVQLRGEVDEVKAEIAVWKQKMDRLALEKKVARAKLSSTESQLQGMKQKNLELVKKIEELQARLDMELAAVKSEVETAKVDAEVIMSVYRSNTKAAQARAKEVADATQSRVYWVAKHIKCQSRKETLEEIHARGFNLVVEIENAKELEAEAKVLLFSDDDDSESGSGSESGGDPDGEDVAPEEN